MSLDSAFPSFLAVPSDGATALKRDMPSMTLAAYSLAVPSDGATALKPKRSCAGISDRAMLAVPSDGATALKPCTVISIASSPSALQSPQTGQRP